MMNEWLGEKFRVMGVDDQGLPTNIQAELAAAQDKSFINWDDIPEDGTLDEASCKEHVLLITGAPAGRVRGGGSLTYCTSGGWAENSGRVGGFRESRCGSQTMRCLITRMGGKIT